MYKISKENVRLLDAVDVYKLVLDRKIKRFPPGFWQRPEAEKNAIQCVTYLVEEILKWDDEKIKECYTYELLFQYRLMGMLNAVFDDSPFNSFNAAYPNRIKPWEFVCNKKGTNNKETAIEATKWLIEEKLKWDDDQILKCLSNSVFAKYGLLGIITHVYNGSVYTLIEDTYPGRFKPWEFVHTPNGYWTKETAREALRWLIQDKLRMDDEDIKKNYNYNLLREHKLDGMCRAVYNKRPFDALNDLYPGRFKPWELSQIPKGYWSTVTAKEALTWLVKEKLDCNKEQIEKIDKKQLSGYGLKISFLKVFDNDIEVIKQYMLSLLE